MAMRHEIQKWVLLGKGETECSGSGTEEARRSLIPPPRPERKRREAPPCGRAAGENHTPDKEGEGIVISRTD